MTDTDNDPISRSDLPLLERLWLIVSTNITTQYLRTKLEDGRFATVEEYMETRRKIR